MMMNAITDTWFPTPLPFPCSLLPYIPHTWLNQLNSIILLLSVNILMIILFLYLTHQLNSVIYISSYMYRLNLQDHIGYMLCTYQLQIQDPYNHVAKVATHICRPLLYTYAYKLFTAVVFQSWYVCTHAVKECISF